MKKIGIYAGAFDPIHNGHLAFAQKAALACGLDKVFFLVEPTPWRKQGVRALSHRQAMVDLAIKNKQNMGTIQLEDVQVTVEDTWPKIQARFKGVEIYLLLGEDAFARLHLWANLEKLLGSPRFIVGVRGGGNAKVLESQATIQQTLGISLDTTIVATDEQDISSSGIRRDLKKHIAPRGLDQAVAEYIKAQNLYVVSEE